MKQIIQISLGSSLDDHEFTSKFQGKPYHIQRMGTDGSIGQATDLILKWNKKADAFALGSIERRLTPNKELEKLLALGSKLQTPITSGDTLRAVSQEWSLRHIQFKFGNNYFNNARVFFFSGITSQSIARVMAEYTPNLVFADPLVENGIPKFANGLKELSLYTDRLRGAINWIPGKNVLAASEPMRAITDYLMRLAIAKAHILVIPHRHFYKYLKSYCLEDLNGKIVITSTAYDDRIDYLKDKGVEVIIDTTPKILKKVAGVSVLEAILMVAMDIPQGEERDDSLLEIISTMKIDPRVIYPGGRARRVNRFAYIVHPPSQEFLRKIKPIEVISDVAPGLMDTVEKAMAYVPPFVYSKVKGIKSHTGVEAEGWLIALGETPAQIQAHGPEHTTKRILEAAKLAEKLGAQIMGIGMLPKAMKDTSVEVAKHAVLPITTGNSYFASAALWAAADAVRRLGLNKKRPGGKTLHAKTMVIGATGAVGRICSHLLATAFEEVHVVGRNIAKLLALQESIQNEAPGVKLHVSTRADTHLDKMDLIVATSSGAKHVLDIMQVKPGCVITDINLPMIFSKEDTAKRPDVLVIRGGEIRLPGDNVEMEDIGLPAGIVYAGLGETIILALEGRFEVFTVGSSPQWDKVREVYRLGLRHGMKLAAISGVEGIFSDEEIVKVRECTLKEQSRA